MTWSNPVAIWWSFLLAASSANIALLLWLRGRFRRAAIGRTGRAAAFELLLL